MPAQQHSVRHITHITQANTHPLTCDCDLPQLHARAAEQLLEGRQLREPEHPQILPDDAVDVLVVQVLEDALCDVVGLWSDASQVALEERGAVVAAFLCCSVDQLVPNF